MSLQALAASAGPSFNQKVEGTWGEFRGPAGRVSYLMTNARLGRGGTDWERRLTARLRPVREILDTSAMDLDQLLQRDLDDHRVATELVPYLLRPVANGPAFIPPILAVLLPFSGQEASVFDPPTSGELTEEGADFLTETSGLAYRSMQLASGTQPSEIHFGRLCWNEENARLVVLDGQHRAMALLAIERTINNSWDQDVKGAKYKHFYIDRIRALLASGGDNPVDGLQVPVTVCWFPDIVGSTDTPHNAARKLFVDVNKNARPPSDDRVVLLSDSDLLNILTRAVLNELRSDENDPPLYAIEYDNPTAKAGRPFRWSAVASLQSIHDMVDRAVFGPDKLISNVGLADRGRPSSNDRDARMRVQLHVEDYLPIDLQDRTGPLKRSALGQKSFPLDAVDLLKVAFLESWGVALIDILARLSPFRAHSASLRELRNKWPTDLPGTVGALASEALFEGVGMYWTLRSSAKHAADQISSVSTPDVVKAWELVESKRTEFQELRARALLGENGNADESEGIYAVVRTMACQQGIALALATLCSEAGARKEAIRDLARVFVDTLNTSLSTVVAGGAQRVSCLAQTTSSRTTINLITKMKPARGVEFRYMWLELLCASPDLEAFSELSKISVERLESLRNQARQRYVSYVAEERTNQVRRFGRTDVSILRSEMLTDTYTDLAAALHYWFNIGPEAFGDWRKATRAAAGAPTATVDLPDTDDDDDDDDYDDEDDAEAEGEASE